ncbi:hypothetical protein D3C85_1721230 [compost metagenome]
MIASEDRQRFFAIKPYGFCDVCKNAVVTNVLRLTEISAEEQLGDGNAFILMLRK